VVDETSPKSINVKGELGAGVDPLTSLVKPVTAQLYKIRSVNPARSISFP